MRLLRYARNDIAGNFCETIKFGFLIIVHKTSCFISVLSQDRQFMVGCKTPSYIFYGLLNISINNSANYMVSTKLRNSPYMILLSD